MYSIKECKSEDPLGHPGRGFATEYFLSGKSYFYEVTVVSIQGILYNLSIVITEVQLCGSEKDNFIYVRTHKN